MIVRNVLTFLFFNLFGSSLVYSQVCVQTKKIWSDVPETYLYTYLEAYERNDCLFWCTDTRVASAVGTRFVKKKIAENTNVCCDGYVEEESNTNTSIHCQPLCNPSCINAICQSPGVCVCKSGYTPDSLEPYMCNPLCLKGCQHGTCILPNICECNPGYKSIDNLCEPICEQACDNGTCIAPNQCQCLPGFKKSDSDICEPYCFSYTADGECLNTIICEPGWEKVIKGLIEICQPICTKPCSNGTCVAPNICKCFDGYMTSPFDTCEPYCSSGCPHGICISPEICLCPPGWFNMESNGACLPHCDDTCNYGTCVAPNICDCFPGFIPHESEVVLTTNRNSLCVPICENCKNPCMSVEECTCESSLIPKHVTIEGIPCNCLGNCSEMEYKCERVICEPAATTITTEDVSDTDRESLEETSYRAATTEHNVIADENSNDYQLDIRTASWFSSKWVYGVGLALLISVVIILMVVIFKTKWSTSFGANGLGNLEPTDIVHYKHTSEM